MTGVRGQGPGASRKRGMIRVKDPEKTVVVDPESLTERMLERLVGRLIGAQKIVLDLAKLTVPAGDPFAEVIILPRIIMARKYVAKEMLYEVGIKKLVKNWEGEEVKR